MPIPPILRHELECLRKDFSKWDEKLDKLIFGFPEAASTFAAGSQLDNKTAASGARLDLGLTNILRELERLQKNLSLWELRLDGLAQNAGDFAVPALPEPLPQNESSQNDAPASFDPSSIWREIDCLRQDVYRWKNLVNRLILGARHFAVLPSKAPPFSPWPATKGLTLAPGASAGKTPLFDSKTGRTLPALSTVSIQTTALSGTNGLMVRIDGRREFKLPATLAALFQVLSADKGTVSDSLVGWKSVDVIQTALAKRLGGGFTAHAVKQLVLRLRKELDRNGEDSALIQSRRNLGYRFAVKRAVT